MPQTFGYLSRLEQQLASAHAIRPPANSVAKHTLWMRSRGIVTRCLFSIPCDVHTYTEGGSKITFAADVFDCSNHLESHGPEALGLNLLRTSSKVLELWLR